MNNDPSNPMRDAWETITSDLGRPDRISLTDAVHRREHDEGTTGLHGAIGWHPCFALMHHYRGHDVGDGGYTGNGYRGDHLSLPFTDEFGAPFVLEVSFHKGDTHLEVVTWPHARDGALDAAAALIRAAETR